MLSLLPPQDQRLVHHKEYQQLVVSLVITLLLLVMFIELIFLHHQEHFLLVTPLVISELMLNMLLLLVEEGQDMISLEVEVLEDELAACEEDRDAAPLIPPACSVSAVREKE